MKASSLEFSSNIKKKLHICVKQKKKQQQENPAVKETIAEGILIWKKIRVHCCSSKSVYITNTPQNRREVDEEEKYIHASY